MERKLNYKILIFSFLNILILCNSACNRTEFMPPPVGEVVPFEDSTLTVEEYMADDTEHALFWRAWRRSNIIAQLKSFAEDYRFTLFLPSNNAMVAAGLDAAWISRASQQQLDSIVQYHITPVQVMPESFNAQSTYTGSVELETMRLESDYIRLVNQTNANNDWPMKFRYKMSIIDGKVYINNKPVGDAAAGAVLRGGTVFPINRVLQKPRKSTRQILVEDGRFKLFLGIRRYNDSLYNRLANGPLSNVINTPYENNQYVVGISSSSASVRWLTTTAYVPAMLNYLADVHYQYNNHASRQNFLSVKQIFLLTVLIPTDEAFHRAGFHSLDDLIAFNHRVPLSESYNGIDRCLPTDSILNYHFMGANSRATPNRIFNNNMNAYHNAALAPRAPMLYYSNELRNEWVDNLIDLHMRSIDSRYELRYSVPPLDFIRDGNEAVRVRVRGSEYEPATLIEKDIETYTGVLHVLDRLLIPPGMKLH